MNSDKLDTLIEQKSMDNFDATCATWIVLDDKALEDPDGHVVVRAFGSRADAVRYARALANGNVDQRVLRVTEQTLVVATDNEL